jgi:CRISPR-associated exonuclease Cas4
MMNDALYLPLSFLNQMAYCPRRFWLMFVQNEMAINAPMQEGVYRHQRAHTPGTDERGRVVRSVQVWSNSLRVIGVADFVEERDGVLIPVEHKRGRMGRWLSDHVQLCAQAICLEERTGSVIDQGEIFYWENRRRERVTIDTDLRDTTYDVARRAFNLLNAGQMPVPIDHPAKCRDCSLKGICMPKQTLRLLNEEKTNP